ncbi:MAG: hypothetical protein ACKVY0_29930 [Prosthecobacter sp.]|uniref:hypothetical protein n=1 Tax=Prosthecobacter sp. TaxID=1965333 RepID=UPI0039027B19
MTEWAEKNDGFFKIAKLGDLFDQGGEHLVYESSEADNRFFKVTHPGQAGLCLATKMIGGDLHVAQTSATPIDYLRRFICVNQIFGDQVRFEGMIDGDQPSLVISQPKLEGTLPEAMAINEMLKGIGFQRTDLLMWYHPGIGIALGDTKRANFLQTPDAAVVPIDVLTQRATPDMAAAWGFPPPDEDDEFFD